MLSLVAGSDVPVAPSPPLAHFWLSGVECIVVALDNKPPPRDSVLATFTLADKRYAILRQAGSPTDADLVNLLTPRELEIAVLVAGGYQTKAIARRLRISFHTVRVHLGRIYGKLGLHKQTELAACVAARFR
jgi:DNA-binding CsgD family transcriptional regulator